MLLHDDIMADGQAKAGAFAGRFGCKEGVEYLFLHLGRDAGAVVADADLDAIAEAARRGGQNRLEAIAVLRLAPACRVEAVRDQVDQHPRDVLRKNVGGAGGGIQGPFERDIEALLLGARAVIGEVEALLDERIDVDDPMLAGALARMQQHVLDDAVGALAVLDDLVEIAAQHVRQLVDLLARLVVDCEPLQGVLQLVDRVQMLRALIGNIKHETVRRETGPRPERYDDVAIGFPACVSMHARGEKPDETGGSSGPRFHRARFIWSRSVLREVRSIKS